MQRLWVKAFRYVHVSCSLLVGALVYSPTLRADSRFALLMQLVVFPLIAFAGCAMWLGPRIVQQLKTRAIRRLV